MCFFSIYDLLIFTAKMKELSKEEFFSHFRRNGITKMRLESFHVLSDLSEAEQAVVLDFLSMSELEINLAMGYVPQEYRASYFSNISNIAKLLSPQKRKEALSRPEVFFQTKRGKLYNTDCIELMRTLPDNSIDLIFADPPFNLGKTYDPGINDKLTDTNYLNWTHQWLDECVRILKPGGRIFVYNLPKWCLAITEHLSKQLSFWAWIAIDMKFSLPIPKRLYPAHYGLVSFYKGEKANTYNNQRIPIQTCRHCGGDIKDYGGYKSKMNPLGVNVSDVWTDIYPVRHKNSKNRKYNELSVKLLERIISISTNKGDVVFDPFGGSGTTYAVAELLDRQWIGVELGDCSIIKNRLLNSEQDKLQLQRLQKEKNRLFTEGAEKLRRKNGFWLNEHYLESEVHTPTEYQISLDNIIEEEERE